MPSHRELDERSLALHRIVVGKLRQDEALMEKVQGILDHWYLVASPRTHGYLSEWRQVAAQGVEACIATAIEDSERGAAMRQASPLACLLSHQERFAFFKNWSSLHASR